MRMLSVRHSKQGYGMVFSSFILKRFSWVLVLGLLACSTGGGLGGSPVPVGESSGLTGTGSVGSNNAAPSQAGGLYSPEYAPPPVESSAGLGSQGLVVGGVGANAVPTQSSGVYSPDYDSGEVSHIYLKYKLQPSPQAMLNFQAAGVGPSLVKAKLKGDIVRIMHPNQPDSCEVYASGGVMRIIDRPRHRYVDFQIKNHPVTNEPNYLEGVVEVAPTSVNNPQNEDWYVEIQVGAEPADPSLLGVYQECTGLCPTLENAGSVHTVVPALACP